MRLHEVSEELRETVKADRLIPTKRRPTPQGGRRAGDSISGGVFSCTLSYSGQACALEFWTIAYPVLPAPTWGSPLASLAPWDRTSADLGLPLFGGRSARRHDRSTNPGPSSPRRSCPAGPAGGRIRDESRKALLLLGW